MDFVRVILFGMNFGIIEINLSEGVFVLDIYIWIPTPYFLRGGVDRKVRRNPYIFSCGSNSINPSVFCSQFLLLQLLRDNCIIFK